MKKYIVLCSITLALVSITDGRDGGRAPTSQEDREQPVILIHTPQMAMTLEARRFDVAGAELLVVDRPATASLTIILPGEVERGPAKFVDPVARPPNQPGQTTTQAIDYIPPLIRGVFYCPQEAK